MNGVRVALYLRVSTEEQAKEGYSLGAQRETLEAYCEVHDFQIVKVYTDDGFSGTNTRRPAYREMLSEIDSWDAILVLKMDRIHRNTRNFIEMMDFLKKGDEPKEALEKASGQYGRVADAVKIIDPRTDKEIM